MILRVLQPKVLPGHRRHLGKAVKALKAELAALK